LIGVLSEPEPERIQYLLRNGIRALVLAGLVGGISDGVVGVGRHAIGYGIVGQVWFGHSKLVCIVVLILKVHLI
jgi:hypothetical protein